MQKILMTLLAGVGVILSAGVSAQHPEKEGVAVSAASVTTIREALNATDDTPVVLTGYIDQHLGGDRYSFRDSTGTITVDIDKDEWHGLTVNPSDLVKIIGEVDKEPTSVEIDAQSIQKIQ